MCGPLEPGITASGVTDFAEVTPLDGKAVDSTQIFLSQALLKLHLPENRQLTSVLAAHLRILCSLGKFNASVNQRAGAIYAGRKNAGGACRARSD